MPPLLNDASDWLDHAEEAQNAAEQLTDREAKEVMLQLGQLYLRHKLHSHRLGRGRVSSRAPLSSGCRNASPQRSGVKPRSSEQGEGPIRISIEKGFEFPKRELQRDLALGGKFAGALAVVVGIGGSLLPGPTRRTR